MKLELKHIAPYLPYGVHLMNSYGNWHNTTLHKSIGVYEMLEMKPILRPLSDLNDEEGEINTPESLQECCYSYVNILISEHYDVFGLIDKGLAIDKNTL